MRSLKHDWNTFENYIKVHESVLKKYERFLITPQPKYTLKEITPFYYLFHLFNLEIETIRGTRVLCNIYKEVEVKDGVRKRVAKTYAYSYQSWIKRGSSLIRYCSSHKTHNCFHHKHDETQNPPKLIKIGPDDWPHVSEFLEELINNY